MNLKRILECITVIPDINQKRAIDSYVNTAVGTLSGKKNPDYGFVLKTLRNEYPVKGLFSHSARVAGEEKIKRIQATRAIQV